MSRRLLAVYADMFYLSKFLAQLAYPLALCLLLVPLGLLARHATINDRASSTE